MIIQILLALMLLKPVFSFQIPEGCEVKSEWEVEYKWPDIHIGAWVSPDSEEEILNIEVLFEKHTYPLIFDSITVYKNRIKFEQIRNGKDEFMGNMTSVSINNGWMQLLLTINQQYSLEYLADNASLLFNEQVSNLPTSLKIKGSNVTYNCPSGLRIWKVTRDPESMPLDDFEKHQLSFYATQSFMPSVSVDMRKVTLGWNGGNLTTIPSISQPLPPFLLHSMIQNCTKNEQVICSIMVGENLTLAEELRFASIPKSLTVAGREGDSFYVMLHENNSVLSENNARTTNSSSSVTSDQNKTSGMETQSKSSDYSHLWISVAVLCVLIFFALLWLVIKKVTQARMPWSKKRQDMKIKEQAPKRTRGKDDGEDPDQLQAPENGEHDPMV